VGILVCNCLDEIGRDGWFCLGALGCDIVLLLLPNTPETIPKIGKKRRLYNLAMTIFLLIASVVTATTTIHNSTLYKHNFIDSRTALAPTIRPPPGPSLFECEEKFDLWEFCLGFCDRSDGEFQNWKCTNWSGYLEMVDKVNNMNWKSPIPFAISLTRVLSLVSILLISFSIIFQMIRPFSHKIKLLMMLTTIVSLMTVLSFYTFNILESHSKITNAAFSATSEFTCVLSFFGGSILFAINFIIDETAEKINPDYKNPY